MMAWAATVKTYPALLTPTTIKPVVNSRPWTVLGTKSPYPTVARVTTALDEALERAEADFNANTPSDYGLSERFRQALSELSERSAKASTGFTNIVTSLAIKVANPEADVRYHQVQIQQAYYSLFSKGEMELRVLDKLNETSHLKSSEIYKQLHLITDNFIQDNPETHYRQTDSHYKVFEALESGLEAMFNDPNYTWAKPEYKNSVLDSASKLLNFEALRYVQTKPSLREDQGDRPPSGWSEDFLRIVELIRSKRSEYPKQAAEMDVLLENIEKNTNDPEIRDAVKLHKKQFPGQKKRGWCDIFG